MSTAYEEIGRVAQKQRTREALLSAARELVAAGESPTVEDAAEASGISRTTAYRYFPNQAALLAAAHPETTATSMLPPDAPADDVEARLALVVKEFTKLILETEAQQRTMLRLSLERPPGERNTLLLRQGRAIRWITEALEPARPRLGDARLKRLVLAIRSATGIEAAVWLLDIAGLSRTETLNTMRWTAVSLLRAALAEVDADAATS
jgi:AcrR family transcriptional regulator